MCGGSDGVLCSADDVQRRNADAWQRLPDVVRARGVEHEETRGPAGSPCRAQPSQVEAGFAFRNDMMNPDSTTYPPNQCPGQGGPDLGCARGVCHPGYRSAVRVEQVSRAECPPARVVGERAAFTQNALAFPDGIGRTPLRNG